jgi:hypothetical protein
MMHLMMNSMMIQSGDSGMDRDLGCGYGDI